MSETTSYYSDTEGMKVSVGDEVVDKDINQIVDVIKQLIEVIGEPIKDENGNIISYNILTDALTKFKEVLSDYPAGVTSDGGIDIDEDRKLRIKAAETEKIGGVKLATSVTWGEDSLECDVEQTNEVMSKEFQSKILKKVPRLDGSNKIPSGYFPDNFVSSRVFGGLVEAKVNGDTIEFTPSIEVASKSPTFYSFQVSVTEGTEITGTYTSSDINYRMGEWDEDSLNDDGETITLHDGDWIYNMPAGGDNTTGILKIVRAFNEVSVKTELRRVPQDTNRIIDISNDLDYSIRNRMFYGDQSPLNDNEKVQIPAVSYVKQLINAGAGHYNASVYTEHVYAMVPQNRYVDGYDAQVKHYAKIPLPESITDLSQVKSIKWFDGAGRGTTYLWFNDGSVYSEAEAESLNAIFDNGNDNNINIENGGKSVNDVYGNNAKISAGDLKGSFVKYGMSGSSYIETIYKTGWDVKNSSWPSFNGGCVLSSYEWGAKDSCIRKIDGRYYITLTYYNWYGYYKGSSHTYDGPVTYWMEVNY